MKKKCKAEQPKKVPGYRPAVWYTFQELLIGDCQKNDFVRVLSHMHANYPPLSLDAWGDLVGVHPPRVAWCMN